MPEVRADRFLPSFPRPAVEGPEILPVPSS
jgi:hypothetical protein